VGGGRGKITKKKGGKAPRAGGRRAGGKKNRPFARRCAAERGLRVLEKKDVTVLVTNRKNLRR